MHIIADYGTGDLAFAEVVQRIRVRVHDHEHEATVSDGAFSVRHGELAFAQGSSGWPMRHGNEVRWIEIFLRGGNAWDLFGRPAIGSAISLA